ncbi:MAG: hypothetical protein WC004_03050, partial [Candidatus Absconditabacterales bacterium]
MKVLKLLLTIAVFLFGFSELLTSEYFLSNGQNTGTVSSIRFQGNTAFADGEIDGGSGTGGICQITGALVRSVMSGRENTHYCCNTASDCIGYGSQLGTEYQTGQVRCSAFEGYSCNPTPVPSNYIVEKTANVTTGLTYDLITYTVTVYNSGSATGNNIY